MLGRGIKVMVVSYTEKGYRFLRTSPWYDALLKVAAPVHTPIRTQL